MRLDYSNIKLDVGFYLKKYKLFGPLHFLEMALNSLATIPKKDMWIKPKQKQTNCLEEAQSFLVLIFCNIQQSHYTFICKVLSIFNIYS